MTKAVFATFNRHASLDRLEPVLEAFEDGLVLETGERVPSRELRPLDARGARACDEAVERLGTFDAVGRAPRSRRSSRRAVEFLLEGLHLQRRLNKDRGRRRRHRTGADRRATHATHGLPDARSTAPRPVGRGRPARRTTRPSPARRRYRAWDGSQDVPDLSADEIVDALADDLLEHGDVERGAAPA